MLSSEATDWGHKVTSGCLGFLRLVENVIAVCLLTNGDIVQRSAFLFLVCSMSHGGG